MGKARLLTSKKAKNQSAGARANLEKTSSSAWVRGIAATLATAGLNAERLLGDAGIDISTYLESQRRWPTDNVNLLWELAAEHSNNPAIALSNPHVAKPEHYGVVGYAMISSPDLITGLERLVRYLGLISDATIISLPLEVPLRCIQIDFYEENRPVPRQRYEYGLLTLLTFCRWMSGAELNPLSASFSFSEPKDLGPYKKAFRCPIKFDAVVNGLWFHDQDLQVRLPTAIPELVELHDRIAKQELEKLQNKQVSLRTREAITRRLPDGDLRRGQIAKDLGFSDRTFQRRLNEEQTSFNELVDTTRQEMAMCYLTEEHLSAGEITYLLGYTDLSTFSRACVRWFGQTPGSYRERHLKKRSL